MVFSSPGVRVIEQDRGAIIPPIATHSAIYLFGTVDSNKFSDEFNKLYSITSTDDFENNYGGVQNHIDLIFAQNINSIVQFTPVQKKIRYTIQIPDPVVDATTYSVVYTDPTNDITTITATADTGSGDTTDSIAGLFVTQLNGQTGVEAGVDANTTGLINVTVPSGALLDSEVIVTLTSVSNGINAIVEDFIDALSDFGSNTDVTPGFIICPEAFEDFTLQNERSLLINTLETISVTQNCVGIIDGLNTDNVNDLVADKNLYGSPRGHLSYFAPWVNVVENNVSTPVPPSPVVASIWAYYTVTEGPKKSPLGSQKVIAGIGGLTQSFTLQDSEIANPSGVNLLLNVKRAGNVIWGGRTISNNAIYQFCNGRVIMNILNETAETAFIPFVGRSLDIQGGIFHSLRNTGEAILFRLFANGSLYGNTAEEAYLCICDGTNNPAEDLETGLVNVDLYAKTTPTLERVLVNTIKVPLTQEF